MKIAAQCAVPDTGANHDRRQPDEDAKAREREANAVGLDAILEAERDERQESCGKRQDNKCIEKRRR
jgi:hypothetical protein